MGKSDVKEEPSTPEHTHTATQPLGGRPTFLHLLPRRRELLLLCPMLGMLLVLDAFCVGRLSHMESCSRLARQVAGESFDSLVVVVLRFAKRTPV